MYWVNGFKANIHKNDLRWLCVLLKTLSEWPKKSRSVYESVERYGGFLLMNKPKFCFKGQVCRFCRNCPSEEDRENLHRFMERVYKIGQLKRITQGDVPITLVKFMSEHGCQLFNQHKFGKRFLKPLH